MFFISWKGHGLMAIAALIPAMAAFFLLIDVQPIWICFLVVTLSLIPAGAACIFFGTSWNRKAAEHTLYFIPLQIWGWIYLAMATYCPLMAIVGGIFRMIKPPKFKQDPGEPAPAIIASVGGALFISIIAIALVVYRSTKLLHDGSAMTKLDAADTSE